MSWKRHENLYYLFSHSNSLSLSLSSCFCVLQVLTLLLHRSLCYSANSHSSLCFCITCCVFYNLITDLSVTLLLIIEFSSILFFAFNHYVCECVSVWASEWERNILIFGDEFRVSVCEWVRDDNLMISLLVIYYWFLFYFVFCF